jgi:hypothetical protein
MAVFPLSSTTVGYDEPRCRRKPRIFSSLSWKTTPRNCTSGWSVRAFATRTGCSSQQGAHHVAQKFSTTGLPLSAARSMVRPVPTSRSANDGAGLPISGERISFGFVPRPRKSTPTRIAAMAMPTMRTVRFMRSPVQRPAAARARRR